MKLELTTKEADVLLDILKSCIDDMKDEIRHTDDRDYKEELKLKTKLIELLLEKVKAIS